MRTLPPDLRFATPRLSLGVLAGVLLVHAGIVAGILTLTKPTQSIILPAPLYVRLIEVATALPEPVPPPIQPSVQPPPSAPKPVLTAPPAPAKPAVKAVQPVRQPPLVEPARPDLTRPDSIRAESQAAPTPAPATATMEAPRVAPPSPPSQPRFNADYLDNPKPSYPLISRRMGEEGEVRLRVHVDTAGQAQQIEIYRSSGSPRLDQAALDTVKQWRFIPARQGDQPVAAWVIVPIQFSLRS